MYPLRPFHPPVCLPARPPFIWTFFNNLNETNFILRFKLDIMSSFSPPSPLEMECEIVKGKFGKDMLYVPCEQMLYVFESQRQNSKVFVCYQTILCDPKKKDNLNHVRCSSRVRLLRNGMCERMNTYIPHTAHPVHKMIADDKRSLENMKLWCRSLQEKLPQTVHRIPTRHIFQNEISK